MIKSLTMEYDTFIAIEKVGGFPVYIKSLKDLDKAVDDLCKSMNPKNEAEQDELLKLCPYFGVIWPAARGLSEFISERKKDFHKKRGLEVGCGLALPSIIATKMGAQMVATDFHPHVESWVQKNCELNSVFLKYTQWDWAQPFESRPLDLKEPFDFILASDVIYEKTAPLELALNLGKYLKATGTIYLADPGRVYLKQTVDAFLAAGFKIHQESIITVEDSQSRPIEESREKKRDVHVYEFCRENENS